MNFFTHDAAAQRYAKSRPYFHPLVMQKITATTGISLFAHAIDVCCGTGMSTLALTEIAERITGADGSAEMLGQAPRDPRISYICCPAEQLQADDASADLMTMAMAFHWVDRARFLAEARRVLRPDGWLVIYRHHAGGIMRGNPDYKRWVREVFNLRYPNTPRNEAPFTKDDAAKAGFEFYYSEDFSNEMEFTPDEMAAYFSTQSRMITAIEGGRETEQEALAWLLAGLKPLFHHERESFPFKGSVWYLRPA